MRSCSLASSQPDRTGNHSLIDVIVTVGAALIGILIPAAFFAGTRAGHSTAEASIDWLRAELLQANDRLFAASREPGVTVPPRDAEAEPAIELPSELEHLIADWEGAQTQELLREQFMGLLQEGYSVSEITRRHLES